MENQRVQKSFICNNAMNRFPSINVSMFSLEYNLPVAVLDAKLQH
jgi:hypothetical protein